jgi:hypothetical protein
MREGRSLDSLQAAYRLGARVAWRRLSAVAVEAGLSPEVLCSLADAIFAYIDELAADSVEGYAQAQQTATRERERRRRRVLTTLLADQVEPDALRSAAADAEWDLPATVALLACEAGDLDKIARRLSVDTLAAMVDELGCIAIADPDGPGRRAELERACDGRVAALGSTQPVEHARPSWERARSALAAMRAGALERSLCIADENLTEIAFFEAREPLRELRARCLAPIDDLTPTARERMTETLKAFLDHRGNAPAMAEALHVHPQTVRYRVKKLRDHFGEALDDPDARFELETAVRIEGV